LSPEDSWAHIPATPSNNTPSSNGTALPARLVKHYRIIEKLGAGGMGEVFLAEDTKLARKVAIKFLGPSFTGEDRARSRLMREARAAAALEHPNICAIYEINEDSEAAFIVMQYVAGETLQAKMRGKPLELREAIDIAAQVAEALAEAHSRNIIHRDIKPQNVIITPSGKVKVLDFGLAKVVQQGEPADAEAQTQTLLTEAGFVMGTVPYMSPEQAKGESLDARSDLFSLGALFYECITGKPAFRGSSSIDTAAQVIHVDPPPPSQVAEGLPPDVDTIIAKALAKRVEARYQSAAEILIDLRKLKSLLDNEQLDTWSLEASRLTTKPNAALVTRPVSLSRKWIVGGSAVVLLLAGFWLLFSFWPGSSHRPSTEARRSYEKGLRALREGGYYQATKNLEQAVEQDFKFPLAHARLADAYAEIDAVDKAKDELLIATSQVPSRSALSQIDLNYLDAIAASVRRDFAAAIDYYTKIADQSPQQDKSSAYVDVGRSYEKNENIDKAIEYYSQAAKADPQSGTAFLRMGIVYGRRGDLESANDAFDNAERIYRPASIEGLAEVLFQRGYLLSKIRKLAEAKNQLEKALELSRASENTYQTVKTQLQLSQVYFAEGDTQRAKATATDAIGLALANNIRPLAANGMIDLGYALISRGEFNDAENNFKQAIDFARSDKAKKTEARAKLGLANVVLQRGNPNDAITLVNDALGFYQPAGYIKETSIALVLLGRAHRNLGEYETALKIFEQQLELAKQIGDPAQIQASHQSMAVLVGFEEERYPEALPHVDESYRINQSLGAKIGMGYDLLNRGLLLALLGRFEQARAAIDQASSIANQPESSFKEVVAWVHLANCQIALTQLRLPQAKAEGQLVLSLAGTEYPNVVLQAKHAIGLARALSGSPQTGRPLCEGAVASARQLNNPRLLSSALLALAEVELLANDSQAALTTASQAQEMFSRAGQQDSEWRALLIAAQASKLAGNKPAAQQYAVRAGTICDALQQKWGADAYSDYLRRPDIQSYRNKIAQIIGSK